MKLQSALLVLLAASATCSSAATITEYFLGTPLESLSYGFPAPGGGFNDIHLGDTVIGSFSFDPTLTSTTWANGVPFTTLPISMLLQDANGSIQINGVGTYTDYGGLTSVQTSNTNGYVILNIAYQTGVTSQPPPGLPWGAEPLSPYESIVDNQDYAFWLQLDYLAPAPFSLPTNPSSVPEPKSTLLALLGFGLILPSCVKKVRAKRTKVQTAIQ
jgi:hypothetical protein